MIVGVGTWRGIGGTTTALATAAGLAAAGHRPWLVEADPAGGVLAARLAGSGPAASGLEWVAFPAQRATVPELFAAASREHASVRMVLAPGDPFRAWSCHRPRLPWVPALRELDGPVVVDLGRLGAGPHGALLAQLDVLLLVANPDTVSLAASLEWAVAHGRVAPGAEALPLDITRIVVVDAPVVAEPVSRADVQAELRERDAGWLPWSPQGVAMMHAGRAVADRELRRDKLAYASLHLAHRLASWVPSLATDGYPAAHASSGYGMPRDVAAAGSTVGAPHGLASGAVA